MAIGLLRLLKAVPIVNLLLGLSFTHTCFAQTPALREPSALIPLPPPRPRPSLWRQDWPTFSRAEGVATLAAGVGTGVLFMLKTPTDPRWEGGVLSDVGVRGALRLHSNADRRRVRRLGDLPYYSAPLIPLIIDPLIISWLGRGDTRAAINLALVGLEAFSYAGLFSYVSTRLSVRERPDSTQCRADNPTPGACHADTESFYSGHTTIVAASSGIVCANHRVMRLWGTPAADVGACALATTLALGSGVSRILADRHYASDVIAGFGTGFAIGYAAPTLFHYVHHDTGVALSVSPGGPCTGACLRLSGEF